MRLSSTTVTTPRSATSIDLARSGTLLGYETLTAKLSRSGYVLLALSSGIGAMEQSLAPEIRAARLVVSVLAICGFLWVRHHVPSYRARLVGGVVVSAWIITAVVLESRTGWPPRIELIPPACVYLALIVDWRLAFSLFIGTIVAIATAYLVDLAPLVPHLAVSAGNWLVVGTVLMFVLHLQLRTFASGINDLVAALRSLEMARAQASEITEELAYRVSERVTALRNGARVSTAAAAEAAHALAVTLQQSRQRVPPEASLSFGKLSGRVIQLRQELLRAFIVVGAVLLPLQAVRVWLAGAGALVVQIALISLLLFGVVWYIHRRPENWRGASRVTAVILVYSFLGTFRYWAGVADAPHLPPSVSLHLLSVVMLGVVTGDLRLMMGSGGAMALAAVAIDPSRGIMTVLACLIWIGAGVMITNLPQDLLTAIQSHRREAADAIRRRRRVIGTLFHDLANPLMVVSLMLEEARASADHAVPPEIPPMVERMRATIDAALGHRDPPEAVSVGALIDALRTVFRRQLDTKHLRLECVGDLDAEIVANRTLLQDTVLANVFSNAIKFSPIGSVITLHVYRGSGEVRLELRDQGPGLPDAVRDALASGRVAPSRTGSAGEVGSGYGLLLATDYLRDMGGALTFEARREGGLTARITIAAI